MNKKNFLVFGIIALAVLIWYKKKNLSGGVLGAAALDNSHPVSDVIVKKSADTADISKKLLIRKPQASAALFKKRPPTNLEVKEIKELPILIKTRPKDEPWRNPWPKPFENNPLNAHVGITW